MKSLTAYIDESGSHGFDFSKSGNSTYFIIAAILVEDSAVDNLQNEFENIKLSLNQRGELKSSNLGKRQEGLRVKLLTALNNLDFKYYCVIVNKESIHRNTGLQYKESFYKFLYGILYNNLYRTFTDLSIIADELISPEFVSGFKKYINTRHQHDLFTQKEILFEKSDKTSLLQLADIIGGSLNRYYAKKSSTNPEDILANKCLSKTLWPNQHGTYTVEGEGGPDKFQEVISKLALLRINDYINNNIDTNEHIVKARVMFLNYLMNVFQFESKSRFVYTSEILDHLNKNLATDIKEQFIRQQIVGPLRSEGILLVSNTNGYKVPSSKNDILAFFNLFSKIINPMVNRLRKSHEAIYQATNGELNILEYPEFEYLKKLID
ncbi:DUF3800 domain-containing protein [Hymenobacter lucidus]|uniref:DUF3800 domain-containing protein n=1 Tax=Hymenobacter lucidus TaxID=2880930 RepID=A0ABS8AR87_9BACT|nr:DUF3800 domain-containing protein [Hymenobacter lucidus]MCB2408710.1 DUF3800 domain-containing protein [Hymenobacter lucidus]